jgi:Putative lumazine-binding
MNSTNESFCEYDAIAKTGQTYVGDAKSGRGADMQSAFHADATIFGFSAGPIQKLFDSVIVIMTGSDMRAYP